MDTSGAKPESFELPAPAALYRGKVLHARLRPFDHRFTYRVFSLLIDLDRLDAAYGMSRLFSINRWNLLSFHNADHGPRDATSLSAHARALLAEKGIEPECGAIRLLCFPRVLGYVFNPLAVYFCYAEDARLLALIYEVRNTFGGLHPYVIPVEARAGDGEIRQAHDKLFYVSPFLDMNMRYHFRVRPPQERFVVRILETDERGPVFAAAMDGERRVLTTAAILAVCASIPFLTIKIIAAIHWQALKLWIKGAKFHANPADAPLARPRPAPDV